MSSYAEVEAAQSVAAQRISSALEGEEHAGFKMGPKQP